MLGVVFCGGKSIRMGTDKGLIPIRDKNWARLSFEMLTSLDIPVVVSINAMQRAAYTEFFNESLLIVDDDALGVAGPLLGLLTAHSRYPNENLLIVACDLPLMKAGLLNRLLLSKESAPGFEAYVFVNKGFREPLCTVYMASGLLKLIQLLKAGSILQYSMRSALEMLSVFELEVKDEERGAFENFNSRGL